MSITTSQQITRYFEEYADTEVTFTRDVIKALRLHPKQVFLKCLGYQWPCIIYSSSMVGAKVIVNVRTTIRAVVKKANNLVSLRFSFIQPDKPDPLAFYVSARISGYTPYGQEKPDLNFVTLSFTQRPADDLIEVLGRLIDANANAKKRREERILITADTLKKIGIAGKNTTLSIQGVPRKCILRDLSFSGAKVIVMGVAKFLLGKEAVLELELVDPDERISIAGKAIRFETVEGRTDIAALAINFDDNQVPVNYKLRLNNHLRTIKPQAAPPTPDNDLNKGDERSEAGHEENE